MHFGLSDQGNRQDLLSNTASRTTLREPRQQGNGGGKEIERQTLRHHRLKGRRH
jgi:hypothetical protein